MYLRGMGQNPGDACIAGDGSAGTYDGNLNCVSNVITPAATQILANFGTDCTAADGSQGSMDASGNCISIGNTPYVPPTGSTLTPAPTSPATNWTSILNSLFTGTTSVVKATTAPTPTYYPSTYVGPLPPGGVLLPPGTGLPSTLSGAVLPIAIGLGLLLFARSKKGGA